MNVSDLNPELVSVVEVARTYGVASRDVAPLLRGLGVQPVGKLFGKFNVYSSGLVREAMRKVSSRRRLHAEGNS